MIENYEHLYESFRAVEVVKFLFYMLGIIVLTCWYGIRKERNERGF